MKWTKEEEELGKKEYLLILDTLVSSEEFENVWSGEWDDFKKESFGKKPTLMKGDKHKFMKYWKENQEIINDEDWNKINIEDDYNEYF